MFKRLNITLPDDVLARADAFATRERYTRSGLIAAAVEAFIEPAEEPGGASVALESRVAYAVRSPETAQGVGLDEVAAMLRGFFAARDDVVAAWLFGSLVRGDAGPMSDIDVGVLTAGDRDRPQRDILAMVLGGRLATVLDVGRVDVVMLRDASVELRHAIVSEGVCVYGGEMYEAAEFEIASLRDLEDFRHVIAQRRHATRERIAGYAGV